MSGSHRTTASGSHRTTARRRPGDRRVGLVIAGVAAGVVACVVAAVVILNSVFSTGSPSELTGGSTVQSSPVSSRAEATSVPDACSALPASVTAELAPGAHVTQNDPFDANDRVSQCTWGSYGAKNRQLTVQLRAIAGRGADSGATEAGKELAIERKADENGDGLRQGQQVLEKKDVKSIGDEGYFVYSSVSVEGYGEGIVNVRTGNILVTVHYAGSNGAHSELAVGEALDGATKAAQKVVAGL